VSDTDDAARGLSGLSVSDLHALLEALEGGRISVPIHETGLLAEGFQRGARALASVLDGLDARAAAVAVRVAIAEREHRPPPRLDLVWTGPEHRTARSRDTAVVVRQLLSRAERDVLVGGFAFDHGQDLFAPLHERMKAHGVSATFFLDIRGDAPREHADAFATEQIDRFFTDNWPFGPPRPDVYYDPRTAITGPPWASLHAKCVVIDDRETLVTSANFTERGQTRNIELGVLIEDEHFARQVVAQWRGLIAGGQVKRYQG
jgi:hypothetical protein